MEVPRIGWMVYFMENTKLDDLGVPLFQEITICIYCIPKGVVKQQQKHVGASRCSEALNIPFIVQKATDSLRFCETHQVL